MSKLGPNDNFVQELIDAVSAKNDEQIWKLIRTQDISTFNSRGKNAAMYVGKSGKIEVCKYICKFGAKMIDCAKGAALEGNEALARELINNNSGFYVELCCFAAWGGHEKVVANLLNDARYDKNETTKIYSEIARHALKGGFTELAQKYLGLANTQKHSPERVDLEPGELVEHTQRDKDVRSSSQKRSNDSSKRGVEAGDPKRVRFGSPELKVTRSSDTQESSSAVPQSQTKPVSPLYQATVQKAKPPVDEHPKGNESPKGSESPKIGSLEQMTQQELIAHVHKLESNILNLKQVVAMKDIAIKNKQQEVGDLRTLIMSASNSVAPQVQSPVAAAKLK
ncbi:MAG: hypothetical protein AB7V32_06270 [Candidatus Berkiella sp.]